TSTLSVHARDPAVKRLFYRLFFSDGQGNPLTLSGFKLVKDDPGFDLWHDTTTLFTRILSGHVSAEEEAAAAKDPEKFKQIVKASGIIIIHFFDFLKQLTTFRTEGPTISDRTAATVRFGPLFMGQLHAERLEGDQRELARPLLDQRQAAFLGHRMA